MTYFYRTISDKFLTGSLESLKELLNSPEMLNEFGSELTMECAESLNRKKERTMLFKDIEIVTRMSMKKGNLFDF